MEFPSGSLLLLAAAKGVSLPEGIAEEIGGVRLSTLIAVTKAISKWGYSWELVLDTEGTVALISDDQSEAAKDWCRNHSEKLAHAAALTSEKAEKCVGLVVPSVLGFIGTRNSVPLADLLSPAVSTLLDSRRPVLFAGYGLSLTFGIRRQERWVLSEYALTSLPIISQLSESYSDSLPFFIEENVRDQGGLFVSAPSGSTVLADRRVVTTQSDAGISIGVHALCALIKESR